MVDIGHIQADELGDPEARGGREPQHGVISQTERAPLVYTPQETLELDQAYVLHTGFLLYFLRERGAEPPSVTRCRRPAAGAP